MKDSLNQFSFEDNKKQIFDTIVANIQEAMNKGHQQIFIKSLVVAGEEVDVVADHDLWPDSLTKALAFYKKIEDYRSCANCQKLLDQLQSADKKTKSNDQNQ